MRVICNCVAIPHDATVQAMYGNLRSFKRAYAAELTQHVPESDGAQSPSAETSASTSASASPDHAAAARQRSDASSSAAATASASADTEQNRQPVNASNNGAQCSDALAGDEECLDVTMAVQFQVSKGQLALHEGPSERKLLGFADVYPGGNKTLWVLYKHKGTHFEIEGAIFM